MVTVKREVTDESPVLQEIQPVAINQFSTRPLSPLLPTVFPITNPQIPWWNPKSNPAPGPQAKYEFEFQGPPPNIAAHGAQVDYQAQLMLLEKENKRRLAAARQYQDTLPSPHEPPKNHSLQDYQMQLMLLEQQRRKRIILERQEQDEFRNTNESAESRSQQEYLMQLMLLEQQNKKRLRMAREEQDEFRNTNESAESCSHQQYQMQLMLLEQQNKKRLRMAREEQDALSNPHTSTRGQAAQGRQVHFMPIEEQNNRRVVEEQQDDPMPAVRPQTLQLSPDIALGGREQSVDSVWSTQFTPESTPGFHEEQEPEVLHCKSLPFRERPT